MGNRRWGMKGPRSAKLEKTQNSWTSRTLRHRKRRDIFRCITKRVPSGELFQNQRTSADRTVNRNAESAPLGFFSFPFRVSCGMRYSTPCRQCLCFGAVPFEVRKIPVQSALFGVKLSDSLVGVGRGVNSRFPFEGLVFVAEYHGHRDGRTFIIWLTLDARPCIERMNLRTTRLTARRGDAVIVSHNRGSR
jgi:hypothetical protein